MKKLLLSLFVIFTLTTVQTAYAADLNLECFSSPDRCDLTGTNPLFGISDGVWYPGKTLIKTFSLKNSTGDTSDMRVRGRRPIESANILEDVVSVSIAPTGGGPVVWSGTLKGFYTKDYIALGTFNPGSSLDYNFAVGMDASSDNTYQGLVSVFDLDLNFESYSTGGGGGGEVGGGGTVLGAGVSAPVCSDTKPGSAPVLLSANSSGANEVILTWSKAQDPVSYYLVAFGPSSGSLQYGNPNVGGSNTTSYTVNGLSGGQTYYFRVRAGNGCTPGDYSNEISVSVGGPVLSTLPSGFQEGVLGVQEEVSKKTLLTPSLTPEPTQKILGELNNQSNWLVIIFVLTTLLFTLYYWYKNRSSIN